MDLREWRDWERRWAQADPRSTQLRPLLWGTNHPIMLPESEWRTFRVCPGLPVAFSFASLKWFLLPFLSLSWLQPLISLPSLLFRKFIFFCYCVYYVRFLLFNYFDRFCVNLVGLGRNSADTFESEFVDIPNRQTKFCVQENLYRVL